MKTSSEILQEKIKRLSETQQRLVTANQKLREISDMRAALAARKQYDSNDTYLEIKAPASDFCGQIYIRDLTSKGIALLKELLDAEEADVLRIAEQEHVA